MRRRSQRALLSVFLGAALLVLVLAACRSAGTPPDEDDEDPKSDVLVEVNLQVTSGPTTTTGTVEPLTVEIRVTDSRGNTVSFDDNLVALQSSGVDAIVLEPGRSLVALSLFEGETYDFAASAFDVHGNFLASGTARRTVVSGGANATNLHLQSHLGTAALAPRLPVSVLLPGQEIDLVLTVAPHQRDDLSVPTSHFIASYIIENATGIEQSGRGARIRAGDRDGGDVVVTATAAGLLVAGGNAVDGNVTASITLTFSSGTGVDLENPVVQGLGFDPGLQLIFGIAEDNFGVSSLDIYDGPHHLASTDLDLVEEFGLSPVTFPGGGTAFFALLDLAPGTYDLTAIARDASGNQGELSREVTIP